MEGKREIRIETGGLRIERKRKGVERTPLLSSFFDIRIGPKNSSFVAYRIFLTTSSLLIFGLKNKVLLHIVVSE